MARREATWSGIQELSSTVVRHNGVDLQVDIYPVAAANAPAVLVLPGGGFRELTQHDGRGYALWLNSIGIGAVVLHYRLQPRPFPFAVQQARTALDALQQSVLLPNADSERIGVIGSSAGGLLAGLLATQAVLSIESEPRRVPAPRFHIQSYGLADLRLLPPSAVDALLRNDAHLIDELSPVTHVDEHTAPTFIWTTAQDGPGLPNALAWAQTLADHEVPVELHIYPEGPHGVGLADGVAFGEHGQLSIPHTAQWTEACELWLRHMLSEEAGES